MARRRHAPHTPHLSPSTSARPAVSRLQRSCPPPPAAPRHCATQPATATATAAACQRRQSRRFRATISAGGSRCRWAATATTAQPTDRPLFYGRGETEPSPAPVPPPPPQAAAAAAAAAAAISSRRTRRRNDEPRAATDVKQLQHTIASAGRRPCCRPSGRTVGGAHAAEARPGRHPSVTTRPLAGVPIHGHTSPLHTTTGHILE